MWIICLCTLIALAFFFVGLFMGLKYSSKEIIKIRNVATKQLDLFKITVKWLKNEQKIVGYIENNAYQRIAIYGMSYLGDCLEDSLRKNGIEVICGIDRRAEHLYNLYIPIYSLENELPEVDLVIVTTIVCFEQIKFELAAKMGNERSIVSLQEILYS